MPRICQGMPQPADNQRPHQRRIAEPDLGFGGVDVHIYQLRVAIHEQGNGGVAVARQEIGIGAAQGPQQQFVPHGSPVDEKMLRHCRPARIGRQTSIARQMNPITL